MKKYKLDRIKDRINEVSHIDAEECRMLFSNPEKDFTRNRKQTPSTIARIILTNSGTNLNEQLRLACGIGDDRPSASAFIQGRDKLTPDIYKRIFEKTARLDEYTLFDGRYLVLACDGSDVNIFPDSEDRSTSVKLSNNPHGKLCNQVHLNALTAVPDGLFVDFRIQDHRDENEGQACIDMMKDAAGIDFGHPCIITCDRGYENYSIMMHAQSLGLKYCIRIKEIGSTGISSSFGQLCDQDGYMDAFVTRKFSRCVNAYGKEGFIKVNSYSRNDFVPESPNRKGRARKGETAGISYCEFSFRLVRFRIAEDAYEVLATNLTSDEMPLKRMRDLYFARWGIETSFRQLKYDDSTSFLHTKKKDAAIGEIILSMAFHNICVYVMQLCARKLARKAGLPGRLHAYKISYSDLADVMRIYITGRDPTATVKKIVRELEITAQPVREGRKFERILLGHTFTAFIYRAA